jgi:Fe(II)/alpha-ketoglutarate-dependent arginine beta-hydroxylase
MPDSSEVIEEPEVFLLKDDELAEATSLVEQLVAAFPGGGETEYLRAATLQSHHLPERLLEFLLGIRSREDAAAFVVSGFVVDDSAIGPTPAGWGRQPSPDSTRAETTWLALCGSVLGDLFGWVTQQDGAIVHDIAPVRGYEHSQISSSSSETLWWHTEDAFHPLRCDYLGLMCLRNHEQVATTFASVNGMDLAPEIRRVLFERRFIIRPDDSHLAGEHDRSLPAGKEGELMLAARKRIDRMNKNPQLVALLCGDFDAPYLSVDPFYMDVAADDAQARRAYEALCGALDGKLKEITLAPGEILFIDNYRGVHGRRPFPARYDGADRWLKRVNIARDLRKSRAYRMTAESRVIY